MTTCTYRKDLDGSAASQAVACLDYWPDLYDTLVWCAVMQDEFDTPNFEQDQPVIRQFDLGGES